MAVQIDKKRKKETPSVELVTPHGAEITVTPSRAEQLLSRPAITFGDGVFRKYAEAGESNVVESAKTGATAPRKGSGVNSGGE